MQILEEDGEVEKIRRAEKQMIWGFVDYENIGSLKDIQFTNYQRLFIFCGPKNPNIKLGNAAVDEFIKIEIIRLKTNGANNLDFHIAYYLGKFSQSAPKEVQFHLFTKDNGFNGLVAHIKKSSRVCQKITFEAVEKQQSVTRLKQIDGRKRPRKEQSLINWIESQCRSVSENINAKSVLGELAKAGLITRDNLAIKYTLDR